MSEFSESSASQQAVQDWWKALGFVPEKLRSVATEGASEYALVSEKLVSRTDIVDIKYFEQTTYPVDEDKNQIRWVAHRVLDAAGIRNIHLRTVLDVATNNVVAPDVLYELIMQAEQRKANAVSYAHAINFSSSPTITAAVWDTGEGRDVDAAVDHMARSLDWPIGNGDETAAERAEMWANFPLSYLARRAIYYRGSLSLAQGDHKVTISGSLGRTLERRDETIEPIEGVVTSFTAPYMLSGSSAAEYVAFHALNAPTPSVDHGYHHADGSRWSLLEVAVRTHGRLGALNRERSRAAEADASESEVIPQ